MHNYRNKNNIFHRVYFNIIQNKALVEKKLVKIVGANKQTKKRRKKKETRKPSNVKRRLTE